MLDFRIYTFIEVCKYMNFTKAAESLNITQPAVSQHIKYLEQLYSVKLFTFTGKKMSLTQYGRLILNTATTMKHDEIFMREKIDEKKNKKKKVKLGVTMTVGECVVPNIIAKYTKEYPNSEISVTVQNTDYLLKMLDSGEIDFAIVEGYFEKSKYDYLTYSTEKYVCVSAPSNSLADKKNIGIENLFTHTLIAREIGSGTREILWKNLREQNYSVMEFNNIIEISNINAIKKMVESDLGITFLYKIAVEEELKHGTLQEIPIKNFDIYHDFTFIWRKNSIFMDSYMEFFYICNK